MPGQTDLELPAGALFDASHDAVVVMDDEGIVRHWNRSAEEMFGYPREAAVGRELAELIIPGPLRDAHRNALRRHLDTGERVILDRRIRLPAMRAGGEQFPVELTVTRIPLEARTLFAGFVRELDAGNEAERENARLQQRMTFLAQAGLVLESSLDIDETLHRLADMTVPELSDMTVIDLIEAGSLVRTAVAAAIEPRAAGRLEQMRGIEPLDLAGEHPVAQVLRSGRSRLLESISPSQQAAIAQGPGHLELIRELHYRSAIVVPLLARQHVLGALSLLRMQTEEPYGQDDLVLAEELARRAALAVDNAHLFSGMRNLAQTLQDSLLPRRIPEIPGVRITRRYLAATQGQSVGGDFYDVFPIAGDRWGIAIGDVCGKGPEAAALTSLARCTIRALADRDPATVLRQLNEAVIRDDDSGTRFLTALLAIVWSSSDGLVVRYASAGHPPALVRRGGPSIELLRPTGPLVGVSHEVSIRSGELRLETGDTLVLYTDGLTDAHAPGRVLTDQDLAALVSSRADAGGEALADLLMQTATGGTAPRDDIALLLVEPRQPAVTENTGGSRDATVVQVAPASPEPNTSPDVAPK